MDLPTVSLADFVQDAAWTGGLPSAVAPFADLIAGVEVTPLAPKSDKRGSLVELLTTRGRAIEPIPHVYQVFAAPQSVRAWVYHRLQADRLAFTNGMFRVVLYDLRLESRTYSKLNEFEAGISFPCLVTIPPEVVHGVKNIGPEAASFVNMPTRAYDPADPDKYRLPSHHDGIPYRFERE